MSVMPTRTPPSATLAKLREEVGFHCPVEVGGDICGAPYLTWHHFEPPWKEEHHHRPDGMIALCREHADKADHGAFTNDQLRRLKEEGIGRGRSVSGRFDWMRRDLLAIVGGSAYLRTPVILQIGGREAIWFNRNRYEEMLLNYVMPRVGAYPRPSIDDNVWTVEPLSVKSIICPPNGRKLVVTYTNGDLFHAEFTTVEDRTGLMKLAPDIHQAAPGALTYPTTVVRIWERVVGSTLELAPDRTSIGTNTISGGFMSDCGIGISLGPIVPARPPWMEDVLAEARKYPFFRN